MFEATVGEYEDTFIIGQYKTEDEALIALARYSVQHNDVEYPRVRDIGQREVYAVMYRALNNGTLIAEEFANEWEARERCYQVLGNDVRATYVRVNV